MELKVLSPKPGSLAPSDCISDPEEKEVSDDDDDDRNHKHRRRDARSQSLERDASEPVISRPFRKHNKTFGNRHHFREAESQAYGTLNAMTEREFSFKFDKRRPGLNSVSRAPMDLSQRLRANQSFPGHPGVGRGRGRESGSWNQRDSRFKSIDVASQMAQQRSIPSNLYTGRGVPNVSNAQSASWNAFGLIPGVPNGGLDMLHPIGLQGTLRPPINASLSMNIPRQRCRDFEEQGFCLRGDMCPMEHGVNRIVVEDVQSLSQFNLPVSLPRAPGGTGSLNSISASTISMNSKGIHGKVSKSGIGDDNLALGSAYSGPGCTSGADLYDPDQPLWNDSGPETSNALVTIESSKIDEAEPLSSDAPSEWHHARLSNAPDNDCPIGTARPSANSQNAGSSVWARIGSSKSRSTTSFIQHPENQVKEDNGELAGVHSGSRQGKRIITEDDGFMDSSLKTQSDSGHNIRKPSQKALRTLFVNGIPQKSNKREALLSHFQKFGEVIDIHIPLNSGRAFVQFSKREEAEAALRAPDAVMGNRFIKLWWANRDSIPDDGINSGNSVTLTPRGQVPALVPSHPVVNYRGKDTNQAASKTVFDISPASDQPKPVMANGPSVPDPPSQKKLENLEQLKEELRKKQEMLDQKRNEFRRQLDKLEKQATGLKSEAATEQAAKRLKMGSEADAVKLASPQSTDSGIVTSPHAETMADKGKPVVNTVSQGPKASTTMGFQESRITKLPLLPLAPVNRYKLDNRPTAFRIIPPLPAGLADAAVLKEHFLPYGELSAVELGEVGVDDSSQLEARISFTTRHAAERAFINGKCWKNHEMKFMWMTSSNFSNGSGSREVSPSVPKEPLYKDDHPQENLENCVTHEAIVSGDEGPIVSEFKNGIGHTSSGEDPQCSPTHVASAKKSPDSNIH